MSIPRKIHYCWFGGGVKSELIQRCIASWRKYCPDCEIIEWNETNYDVNKNKYMQQAYQEKRWSFACDYARLDIVYENGGIYFDTDVELIKNIEVLFSGNGFIGFESKTKSQKTYNVNTGQGFGAPLHCDIIKQLRDCYNDLSFIDEYGNANVQPCPLYNTEVFKKNGLILNNRFQVIHGFDVYPAEYFCPYHWDCNKMNITENTFSIHHFNASWLSDSEKKKRKIQRRLDWVIHTPNRLLLQILGSSKYDQLKSYIKKNKNTDNI